MTALSDLLTQAANIAREEGQLWLVSRIAADMVRLAQIESAARLNVVRLQRIESEIGRLSARAEVSDAR